jgi:hypothetical protein
VIENEKPAAFREDPVELSIPNPVSLSTVGSSHSVSFPSVVLYHSED